MISTSDIRGAGLKVQTEELFLMSHSSNWCGPFRPKSNSHVFLVDAIQLTSDCNFSIFFYKYPIVVLHIAICSPSGEGFDVFLARVIFFLSVFLIDIFYI